jgi:signal transduction histidine kinase
VDVASNVAQVANKEDTAGGSLERRTSRAAGAQAHGEAEIAEGIAEVTATLAEERDVDDTLRKNAASPRSSRRTEEVRPRGLDLDQEREVLGEEREATDDYPRGASPHRRGRRARARLLDHETTWWRNVKTATQQFLGIVSHDLRGPLMTIAGLATLIEQNIPADDGQPNASVTGDKRSVASWSG